MFPRFRLALGLVVTISIVLGGCLPPGGTARGSGGTEPSASPIALTVGLGYIPSVQFAPFYLAQQNGSYAAAGLNVTFQNKIEPDLVTLVAQGSIDIGIADGTDVIPAVSREIPIKYIATLYGTFPNVVFAKASSGIGASVDLKGKRIGTPGKYGSSWIMLQAILGFAGLTPDDVTVVEYPDFGQGVAVQQGAVDAATGFTNNEPVQMELTGTKAVELHVDPIIALPGPGLIVGQRATASKADAIRAFVAATLDAMNAIKADPQKGLDASIAAVPDLGTNRDTQLAILNATIATWSRPGSSATAPFGAIDRNGWAASIGYMSKLGLVASPVTVDQLVSTDYLPPVAVSPSP